MGDDVAGKWFDELIGKGRKTAEESRSPEVRRLASAGFDALDDNKDAMLKLGKDGVMELIGLIGRGDRLKAEKLFIAKTTDPEALIAGMLDSAEKIEAAPDSDALRVFRDIVISVTEHVARAMLPVLLAAI